MMKAELLILRLVHVLGGIFWVGGMMYSTFFLVPALGDSPAAAGQVMAGLQKRRLFMILPIVALLVILSGIRLMWIASAGFSESYLQTPTGRTFSASALAAIVAFLLSVIISRPTFLRIGRLGASLGSTADPSEKERITAQIQRLRRRVTVANGIVVVLLLFAASGMAIARYM
jgi:uncharacterized membrane protein